MCWPAFSKRHDEFCGTIRSDWSDVSASHPPGRRPFTMPQNADQAGSSYGAVQPLAEESAFTQTWLILVVLGRFPMSGARVRPVKGLKPTNWLFQ